MPAKVKVKVVAGRDLPVMDKSSDTTDAYVELKLGGVTHKTDVCRKSLNPHWACPEWYRFEVDDADLQDEPLQLRLMDHDTYSANDAIGKVYISLNPLLLPLTPHPEGSHTGKGAIMSGWIPVFDTMHGIRGEVNVIVKVELFNDFNKFRQSSCGVQFFHSPIIPHGYQVQAIHGFVEELVVNDDPEYQWIDKIRTPRASNEARQVAFLKLSGQVQRKIGLKALELGANAVIGFKRCLDLEGEVGVVARGAGTAVTLARLQEPHLTVIPSTLLSTQVANSPDTLQQSGGGSSSSPAHTRAESQGTAVNANINITHRRSSDSDLSITPKGGSLTTGVCGTAVLRASMNQDNLDLLEYPFLTIVKFPPGFILHLGGAVAARSVKLLERVPNPEEPAPRDAWWSELRTEVRSHMRALRCNAVLAYQETTTICDDVCVLSATGTAAVIDLRISTALPYTNSYPATTNNTEHVKDIKEHEPGNRELTQTSSLDRTDFDKIEQATSNIPNPKCTTEPHVGSRKRISERCGPCHLPYNSGSVPFSVSVSKCAVCKKSRVPSVMLCSIEPIDGLSLVGRGCLVQAVASRARVPQRGEPAARDISDQLPFLEYELHRLLLAKLRVRGMNAIFGLKTTIAVGATVVAAVGVGTGVLLAALGTGAGGPKLRAAGDPRLLRALQRGLDDALHINRNVYHLNMEAEANSKGQIISDTEESEEELPDMEINAGNKDTCVLEVDDAEDLEVLKMLTEARPPAGVHVVNTQSVPGLPSCETLGSVAHLQMFTQLWRARLASPTTSLHQHFHRLLQSVYFKLRRMVPCAVCDLRFRLDLPEADEIQLVVTGMALGISESAALSDNKTQNTLDNKKTDKDICAECPVKKSESSEMIFSLDEEASIDINNKIGLNKLNLNKQESPGHGMVSNLQNQTPNEWRPSVVMTPLASIPGGKILHYLGNLDFIFVRESTSVREQGGLSGFLHTFISEVLAVVRAHVTALGGNAVVAFYMTELILSDNPHKNQAQCLVSVGGDVAFVSYFPSELL